MNPTERLREDVREVRRRYDRIHRLKRGRTAPIRHCRTADEVALEKIYWEIGEPLAREQHHLAHVVLLFPLAPQRRLSSIPFSFGRFLRRKLGDGDGAALRFRRLLACRDRDRDYRDRDRDELDHHLRRVLRLACADKTPVDWGVLGVDILRFFADSDNVRRTWAQDFYAPISLKAPVQTAGSTSKE